MKLDEITLKTPLGKIVDCLREADAKAKADAREIDRLRHDLQEARSSRSDTKIERLVEQVESFLGSIDSDESLDRHNLRMAAHDVRKELGC